MEAIQHVEQQCSQLHMGKIEWSLAVMRALDALCYWKLMQKNGRNVNTHMVYRLTQKLHLSFPPPHLKQEATSHLLEASKYWKKLKQLASNLWNTHMDKLMEVQAQEGGKAVKDEIKSFRIQKAVEKQFQNMPSTQDWKEQRCHSGSSQRQ